MRILCVAEKPSISKAISGILSGGRFETENTRSKFVKNYIFDYLQTNSEVVFTCVAGHLTEYDFTERHRKWYSCNPVELFDAPVECRTAKDKKDIEQNLLNQARRCDMLMIWTDCDREGEHIGMEIVNVCKSINRTIQVKRARFSAIIAQQIHRAMQHPIELDRAQADAVDARILLDLKVGAAFTRMQTLSLQTQVQVLNDKMISYGPCQFPTLGFVVQRYNRVQAFVPEPFWYIFLSLNSNTPEGRQETVFNWKRGHLFDEDSAVAIYAFVLDNPTVKVEKVTNKDTKKWKPLPLTTVELQKAGSRLLKMAPKKVLDIAEKLYQQGFVSYPRTETDQFDNQFDFMSLIQKQTVDPNWGAFARTLGEAGFNTPRKGKNNDKAHPPIHPTAHAAQVTGDEKRVYEYITRRFLACCSKDAEGWQTMVEVSCNGEWFSATGLVVTQRNYLDVYPYDKWVGNVLPAFREGDLVQPSVCELRDGQTSKPNLLTEADLVSLMDKNGIGTDATIAQHIQTILDREYVIGRMEGTTKYLVPSTLGIGLIEGYNKIGLDKSVSKPLLRRETERRMVQVCERVVTKEIMLERSLEQYKEMFRVVGENWNTVVQSVRQYLDGNPDPDGAQNDNNRGRGRGGGARNNGNRGPDDDDDDDDDGGGGNGRRGASGTTATRGTRGGRGTRGTRGTTTATRGTRGTTTSTRGRGGGRARGGVDFEDDDDEMEDWFNDDPVPSRPAPVSASRGRTMNTNTITIVPRNTVSSSTTTASSTFTSTSTPRTFTNTSTTATSLPATSSSRATLITTQPRGGGGALCGCGIPALMKISTSGLRAGKPCWICSKDVCGYWEWADPDDTSFGGGGGSNPGPSSSSRIVPAKRDFKQISNTGGAETNDNTLKRSCKCGVAGVMYTVNKEGPNQGRKFWKCTNNQTASDCGFFEWDDEPSGGNGGGGLSGSVGGGGAGSQTGACFKCGEKGHWSTACPNDGGPSTKRARSFGNSTNTGGNDIICFKCQEPGHFATACTNGAATNTKSKSFNSSGGSRGGGGAKSGGGGGDSCYNCGKSGHWSSACPKPAGGTGFGTPSSSYGRSGRGGSGGGTKRGRGRSTSGTSTSTRGTKKGRGGKKSSFAAADGR